MPRRYTRNLGTWLTVGVYVFLAVIAIGSWQLGVAGDDVTILRTVFSVLFMVVALLVVVGIIALAIYIVDAIMLGLRRSALKKAASKLQLIPDNRAPIGSALYGVAANKPASIHGYRGKDWSYAELEFSHISQHLDLSLIHI